MAELTLKLDRLEKMAKLFKTKPPRVHIGVLGNQARSDSTATNAMVGMAHEYGTSKLPQRSFLRVPLGEFLETSLDKAKVFSEQNFQTAIDEGTFHEIAQKIASVAEGIVMDAFDSGGFGKWPPGHSKHASDHKILIETEQLKNSIKAEVV